MLNCQCQSPYPKNQQQTAFFNYTAQRATRNKVLYISYVLSQHIYLAEQKSTGMKLPSAFWKMQWISKCLFEWMSTETVTNKLRSSDQKLYVTDTEGIPATYETSGNRASWWETEHNVYFTESSWTILAHWGSSLACDKRFLSVVGLPPSSRSPLTGYICLQDLRAWAALTGFLTALRSKSCTCSFSLLADKWLKRNALILLNHKALATLL